MLVKLFKVTSFTSLSHIIAKELNEEWGTKVLFYLFDKLVVNYES